MEGNLQIHSDFDGSHEPSFLQTLEKMSPAKTSSLARSMEFISSALQRIGINKTVRLDSCATEDAENICDLIYTLLIQYEKSGEFAATLQQELQESRSVIQMERKEAQRLGDVVDTKDRALKAIESKSRVKDETLKDELKSSKALVGNLKGRVKASEAKINHMVHELKKKECEYARLQERLSKHLRDSSTKNDGKALLDISGSLGKVIGSPAAMSKRQERQDDAVKGIITSFEMRERELQNEVKELKGALASMQEQYIQAVNDASEKRDRVINDSSSIIDTEFIESIPTMTASQLGTEISTRIKMLQRRLGSLDWHSRKLDSSGGPLSVREESMLQDLSLAKSVLHDQEALLTNVLVSLRSSLVREKQQYESKMRDMRKKYDEKYSAMERRYALSQQEHDEEIQAQIASLKQEYEAKISQAITKKDEYQNTICVLEEKIAVLQSNHNERLQEELKKLQREFDTQIEEIQAGAEATMQSMAEESSKIQLDYKRTHNTLRSEAAALRERLMREKTERENLEERMREDAEEALSKALLEHQNNAKHRIQELQIEKNEQISKLQESYHSKIDMLLKEKEALEETMEASNMDLIMTKDKLKEANESLENHKMKLHEMEAKIREIQNRSSSETSLEVARTLEKAEQNFIIEKQEMLDKMESIQEDLRHAESTITEKEDIIKHIKLKEAEATMVVARYEEMTKYYKDLMTKHAPGLGAGTFLEKAIQQRASSSTRCH